MTAPPEGEILPAVLFYIFLEYGGPYAKKI